MFNTFVLRQEHRQPWKLSQLFFELKFRQFGEHYHWSWYNFPQHGISLRQNGQMIIIYQIRALRFPMVNNKNGNYWYDSTLIYILALKTRHKLLLEAGRNKKVIFRRNHRFPVQQISQNVRLSYKIKNGMFSNITAYKYTSCAISAQQSPKNTEFHLVVCYWELKYFSVVVDSFITKLVWEFQFIIGIVSYHF